MLLNLIEIQNLFSLVIFIVAYFVVVTITEVFQTKIALFLGDDTAYQEGYDSWNPLDHFHIVQFLLLVFLRVLIPSSISINILNFYPNITVRMGVLFVSELICNILLSVGALLMSYFAAGVIETNYLFYFISGSDRRYIDINSITKTFPNISSLSVVIGSILATIASLTVYMTTFYLIINFFRLIVFMISGKTDYDQIIYYGSLILTFLTLLFMGGIVQLYLMSIVSQLSYAIYLII